MSRDEHLCWFAGKISREAAEELIKQDSNEDGTFLVRESNSAAGDFVLTLLYQGEVCHYQIRKHGEDAFFSIDDKVKILHGLDTLVEFYQQAANGLATRLTKHIIREAPPNDTRRHGATNLLHRAIKENNRTVVSELLKCGYRNVDAKNQDGQTAMHLAALYCDEEMLKLLLNANVNVNCMDILGNMPLHYACRSKSGPFIRMLIEAHANVQGRNMENGYVPLHEAAKGGNLEAVKELLAAHAPLLPRTSFGEFPIDLATEAGQSIVVDFLSAYKIPPANTFESQWYHGTLKREEAVTVLERYADKLVKNNVSKASAEGEVPTKATTDEPQGPATDSFDPSGCFLVRYSERKGAGSGYVLTLLWDKKVKNFIISKASNYLYIDNGPYLPSLPHLVEHFMHFADGLPVRLKYPVLPEPKPPLPLFSTMPRSQRKLSEGSTSPSTSSQQHNHAQHHQNHDQAHQRHRQQLSPDSPTRKHSLDALKSSPDEKLTHTLNPRKKAKEHTGSVFHTLKLRSPRKNLIDTLRRSKVKPKGTVTGTSPGNDSQKSPSRIGSEDELKSAESLLKDLSFSTEFTGLRSERGESAAPEEFYNTPKNNAAIPVTPPRQSCIAIENKTQQEVEYFTKSDVAIERERERERERDSGAAARPALDSNNGYVPTVDVRVFLDNVAGEVSNESLEASAAELREFSNHPERLDSILSSASNDSDIMRYFNRQSSTFSNTSQSSEVAAASQLKLNYFIPRECLELETIIGEGEFGSVYKGSLVRHDPKTDAELRCQVAIKTLRDEHCRANKKEFLREASVMIRLQHHCIVQLIGISKGETLMMVQEIVPLGSMLHFILEHRDQVNPNYELKLWASQIACGMEYLESQHFVHRDLAARNILLASRNQAKISDFGLSRALGSGHDCYQATNGGKWPIKWYAPESFNNGLFSHASDVWSFGVTLWEMFSLGEPPYGDIRGVEAIQMIESGQRLPRPELCPDNVYEIMLSCWNYRAQDRPTFLYLTNYFAKDPDYQNILELVKSSHIS